MKNFSDDISPHRCFWMNVEVEECQCCCCCCFEGTYSSPSVVPALRFNFNKQCLWHLWSISSTLYARIFRTNVILAAFVLRMYVCVYVKKAAIMTFVRNIRTFNVDEIDTCTLLRLTKKGTFEKCPLKTLKKGLWTKWWLLIGLGHVTKVLQQFCLTTFGVNKNMKV